VSSDFTVRLEQVFQGPLDLLLHLVREQEVEIHEIEINRVIDGYLTYLKDLEQIDIELAGDFVLMAATLMAIKSRSLLPREEVDLEAELDPRDELIQRLIEYRHFKGASRDLGVLMHEHSRRYPFGHRQGLVDGEDEPTLDFSEITQWDLLSQYSRLMRETMSNRPLVIASDDRPLRWYVERLVRWVKEQRTMTLRAMVEQSLGSGEASKPLLIGSFCALLELMKMGVVGVQQSDPQGEIMIHLREDVEGDAENLIRMAGFGDEVPADLADVLAEPQGRSVPPASDESAAEG